MCARACINNSSVTPKLLTEVNCSVIANMDFAHYQITKKLDCFWAANIIFHSSAAGSTLPSHLTSHLLLAKPCQVVCHFALYSMHNCTSVFNTVPISKRSINRINKKDEAMADRDFYIW